MNLSVVMPVRNAAPFLDASIGSILGQTMREFELVILDDASGDDSTQILERWARRDSRIRLHRSDIHLGVVGASNRVVELSHAPLVARMDADDIAHRERLARQLAVLSSHPDVVLAGTMCDGIDARGRRMRPRDGWRIVRRSSAAPFPHGSIMFRRSAFDAVGGYREEHKGTEDHDLFHRLVHHGGIVVLPEVLYHYRYHAASASAPAMPALRKWLEPSLLRFALGCAVGARDLVSRIVVREGKVYPWRYE